MWCQTAAFKLKNNGFWHTDSFLSSWAKPHPTKKHTYLPAIDVSFLQ